MMAKVIVTDRTTIERGLVVRSTYAVISIRDTSAKPARIQRTTALRAVLHLAFDDAEPTDAMRLPANVAAMAVAQAKNIWEFVDLHKADVGTIVVHCHQGMSRSPAVAAAVARYLGCDETAFWREYVPNAHVYRLMRETMPAGPGAIDRETTAGQ